MAVTGFVRSVSSARGRGGVLQIDIANGIFVFCLAVGGGLLLLTVVLDDIIGGMFDALHIGVHVGGVALMPPLLGFVSMFGIGGLFGTHIFKLVTGAASLLGGVAWGPGLRRVF